MTENELAKKNAQFAKGVMELAFRMGYVTRDDELIRCKYCKHWQCDDSESYCDELGIFDTDMNSYCSYAKRKEE